MKIYIDNYNPNNLLNKLEILEPYIIKYSSYIEILSDDGIYYINETGNINKINNVKDESVKITNILYNYKFLIDLSIISYENVTSIPLNHVNNKIFRYDYKIDVKSNLKLIIEFKHNETKDTCETSNINNELTPINFYFEYSNKILDYNEIFNNNDFNVFLSLLK